MSAGAQDQGACNITVSLQIENTYELHADVTTHAVDVVLPAPPGDPDGNEDWAQEFVFAQTGSGHTTGDAWYDVTVTASSHPDLLAVGTTFEYGY